MALAYGGGAPSFPSSTSVKSATKQCAEAFSYSPAKLSCPSISVSYSSKSKRCIIKARCFRQKGSTTRGSVIVKPLNQTDDIKNCNGKLC